MKKIILVAVFLVFIAGITGCAPMTVAVRSVTVPPSIKQGDVIEMAIESAREVNFPPATKIDKENGIVEFGSYEGSVLGITAQVRVKSPAEIEVTVKRASVYIPLGADKQADDFVAKLKEQFGAAAVSVVK